MRNVSINIYLQKWRPPRSTRTDTLGHYTTRFRSFNPVLNSTGVAIAKWGIDIIGIATQQIFTIHIVLMPPQQIIFRINEIDRDQRRVFIRTVRGGIIPVIPALTAIVGKNSYSVNGGIDPVVEDRKSTRLNSSH